VLRWTCFVLLVLLIALQVHLWAGQGGLRELWRIEQRVEGQKEANAQLKKRNDKLSAEVEDLKQGSEAIEERARAELGLLKPGETFYRVVDPDAGSAPAEGGKDAGDD
jgi:cell division protein FtsB